VMPIMICSAREKQYFRVIKEKNFASNNTANYAKTNKLINRN